MKDKDQIDINDTENIRTMIVNQEYDENNFTRYQVNIDWTLQQLNDFITE